MVDVQTLARQVKELAGEVDGEKIVTRHILEQLRQNTDILLEFRGELTALHQKVDKIGDAVALLGAQVTSLEPKLSGIVADALRDVLRQKAEG
jgi:outer membrane murein-binding lipoprotein Lpp